MNLLLLLSALLSALTGVGATARAPSVAQAAVRVAEAARHDVARPGKTVRPIAAIPAVTDVAPGVSHPVISFAAPQPLWASRRRE